MSDHGEKTCPLCAEEMDLTDQQLKPCRCGYEICVWCWHHIMDMAEKDESEGRCPACRSPYDKEKIVGTEAKCERLVAETSMERKMKPQKTKAKPSEGRKQLSSVRVIQRNLVYIVGLPLDLGDEDLLQRKEYFGQYGKVLKVSMSRTAAGVVQQFPNNTCSLYITYSKDEEAIRCIQSVHAFVLDGRSLKACFGTTKYCHAWLRNMPCSNLDCLYLHEIGLQEDSYTKDEIISAYSSVPQITGAISNLQRRAGTVLPPPVDLCIISSASSEKNLLKNGANNSVSTPKGSPPNSSSGRSTALPAGASWGTRGSNVQALTANAAPLNGLLMKKGELTSAPVDFSLAVTSNVQDSNLHNDAGKKVVINEDRIPQATKKLDSSSESHRGSYTPMSASEKIIKVEGTPPVVFSSASQDKLGDSTLSPQIRKSVGLIGTFQPTDEQKDANDYEIEEMCSDMSSVDIARNLNKEPAVDRPHHYPSEHILDGLSRDRKIQPDYVQQPGDAFTSAADRKSTTSNDGIFSALRQDPMSDTHAERLTNSCSDADEDVQSFNDQRLYDSEVFDSAYLPNLNDSLHILNNSSGSLLHRGEDRGLRNFNTDTPLVNRNGRKDSLVRIPSASIGVNGYPENLHNSIGLDAAAEKSYLFTNEYKRKQMGRSERHAANFDRSALVDMGESSIISNILSMEFDADDSLTTPQNLAKLLNETNKEQSLLRTSNSWRAPNSNQSRFSFARKDGSNDQVYSEHSITNSISQVLKSPFSNSLVDSQDAYLNTCRYGNGFSGNFEELRSSSSQTVGSSSKVSISRAQISAPPGFSVLNRAPPPGFTSHGSVDHSFDPLSGNHLLEASSPLRNLYQDPPMSNFNSTADIEFMDPAILAVGKGIVPGGLNNLGLDVRSNFPSQISAFEKDARLELLMQRSLSQQQNLRYTDTGSGFSHLNDNFSVHRHLIEQSQPNNHSPFEQLTFQQSRNGQISNGHISNGHWDVWNDVQKGNNFHAVELLRNERLGFNKLRNGYEDSKFWVPSSGDLYSRNFGM